MPGLIFYDEIKQALGLPKSTRLATVERVLRKRGLPFEYGETGVFSTLDLWNAKIAGQTVEQSSEPIEF